MVEPEAEIAAAITETGRIGVLATPATVEGGAYRRALERQQGRELEVTEVAAPDLAPIIQNGFPFDEQRDRHGALLLRAAEAGRDRHPDPRLHPLSAGGADAAADARPRRAPGHRRARGRRDGAARAASSRTWRPRTRARATTVPLHRRRRSFRELGTRFLQMPLGEVERVEPGCVSRPAIRGYPVPVSILEQVQADTREAMKAGERDRVGALRMLANALQQDAKLGDDDEIAVLQRERKKRLEAAEAFREGGSEDRAAAERVRGGADRGLPARAALRRRAGGAGRRARSRRPAHRSPARWAR